MGRRAAPRRGAAATMHPRHPSTPTPHTPLPPPLTGPRSGGAAARGGAPARSLTHLYEI
jgi:hypothetical protein